MRGKGRFFGAVVGILGLVAFSPAQGYVGGPLLAVTDTGPFCASCHSSADREQLRGLPPDFIEKQIAETKHYKAIREGLGPYKEMSSGDRERLLEDIKVLDSNARVALTAPATAGRGQTLEVTVTTRGGAGPVIAVMLVDTNHRFQSRPINADGWMIMGAPKVIGPDGHEQTKWVDSRIPELKKNLNFLLVFGIKSDLANKIFPETKVTYTLRAPSEPGKYTMAAVLIHGTEKASPVGVVQTATGPMPRGGASGPSSRIRFSEVKTITVQ